MLTNCSVMDVVRTVNDSNLILPAGDVKIGPIDYNLYTNSQVPTTERDQRHAVEDGGQRVGAGAGCRARRKDAQQIQTNIVRVDGQRSVYLPILKQGGDTNTIAVVNGIKDAVCDLDRCSQATRRQGGFRPIGLREDGD